MNYQISTLENLEKCNALPGFDYVVPMVAAACRDWWSDSPQNEMTDGNGSLHPWLRECIEKESVLHNWSTEDLCNAVAKHLERS